MHFVYKTAAAAAAGTLLFAGVALAHGLADAHESQMASVIEGLKGLERTSVFGKDAREAEHEIASSTERAKEALEKVQNRSKVKTFLIGTDYKNVGQIRSEMVTLQNTINRLTKVLSRATSTEVRTALQTQIDALKSAQSSLKTFVQSSESSFSLFGWFFRYIEGGKATTTATSTATTTP